MGTNADVIKSAMEHLNRRELAELAALSTPTMVRHDLTGSYPGVDASNLTSFLSEILRGAPDLRITADDLIEAGDKVVTRVRLEGTHEGPLFGRPPTGKRFSMNQINIYRFEGGKIAETWQLGDVAGFVSQIGG